MALGLKSLRAGFHAALRDHKAGRLVIPLGVHPLEDDCDEDSDLDRPTPEEIAALCLEIQAGWSDTTRRTRWVGGGRALRTDNPKERVSRKQWRRIVDG